MKFSKEFEPLSKYGLWAGLGIAFVAGLFANFNAGLLVWLLLVIFAVPVALVNISKSERVLAALLVIGSGVVSWSLVSNAPVLGGFLLESIRNLGVFFGWVSLTSFLSLFVQTYSKK